MGLHEQIDDGEEMSAAVISAIPEAEADVAKKFPRRNWGFLDPKPHA